ncbi:MAG: rod shape-determining protein RodA [Bacteroidota bacterium]
MIESYLRDQFDWKTLLIMLVLLALGLISIYSATYDAGASENFYKQVVFMGIGLFAMAGMMLIPFRTLQLLSYVLYFASLLLLAGVLIGGKTVSGSTSWFTLGPISVQPSEFMKLTTILAIASFLSRSDVDLDRFKYLAGTLAFTLVPVFLILLQPDIGTALVYLLMVVPIVYWSGASGFMVIAIISPPLAAIAALFGLTPFLITIALIFTALWVSKQNRFIAAIAFSVTVLIGVSLQYFHRTLPAYQQRRIEAFLDPHADPLGAGYNVIQSTVAIGSGGLWGKGHLQGTQTQLNFIPEQWTDFIFCVPGEEFGFVGALVVLMFLNLLLFRGVRIASTVKNRYASIAAIGITTVLGIHTVINIGMSVGLLPVIGIPLPFLSYGGSALISSMMMVGILMNFYANRKEY